MTSLGSNISVIGGSTATTLAHTDNVNIKSSYADLVVLGALGNSSEDESYCKNHQNQNDQTKKESLEGEQLLNSLAKLSKTKQQPHSSNENTDSVCVCSEPFISKISSDISVIVDNDPAFDSYLELILYPGLWAITTYRIAHCLYYICSQNSNSNLILLTSKILRFFAKLMCIIARSWTGIEIHPGSKIGKGFFIDHGSGVVIGETAIVGNYCTLYQGVTLGGTGKESGKRHPTLGDNVLVGAGSKVLGNIIIGSNVKIGAGSVVVKDAPSDCTLVGIPARCIKDKKASQVDVPSTSSPTTNTSVTITDSTEAHSTELNKKKLVVNTTITPQGNSDSVLSPTSIISLALNSLSKKPQQGMPSSSVYQYDDIDAQAIRALYIREKRLEQELLYLRSRLKLVGISLDSSDEEQSTPKPLFNKLKRKKKASPPQKISKRSTDSTNTEPISEVADDEECFRVLFESTGQIDLIDGGGI